MKLSKEARAVLAALLDARGFGTYAQLIQAAGIERGHGEDKALRSIINDLRIALRPHGVAVIDMYGLGFGIPDADMDEARAIT